MNLQNRINALLNQEEPDRVPIWTLINNASVFRHFNPPGFDFSPFKMTEADSTSPFKTTDAVSTSLAKMGKSALHGLGIDVTFSCNFRFYNPFPAEDSYIQVKESGKMGFNNISDLAQFTPEVPSYEEIAPGLVKRFQQMEKALLPDTLLVDQGGACYDFAHNLIGMELFCIAIYDAPGDISRILDAITERERIVAQIYADHRLAPAYQISGDIAGKQGVFFSPDFIKRELIPLFKRQIEPVKQAGIKVIYHSDGNLMEILDDLVDAGIDALNPVESTAGMNLAAIKKRYGKNLILIGNVDANIMTLGSPDQVEEEVKRCLREGAPGGGYCLDTGAGEIMPGYPVQNVIRMCEAVREFGRYPISTRL